MCFGSCLRGRDNEVFCGCSTRTGINLIYLLAMVELIITGYLFLTEIKDGIFNLKVFMWVNISFFRIIAYFSMCFDSISKRSCFMWVLIATTVVEIAMFTILNVGLFDGDATETAFKLIESWGMGDAVQVAFIEICSILHLLLSFYFCAIAYEWYCIACDDPKMIEQEH